MNRTRRSRRSAACMRATGRARPCWSNTASACRARWTTGRSASRSFKACRTRRSTPAPRPARGSWSGRGKRPSVVEQIVRPTGLVDPKITLKPLTGQIDDLINECRQRAEAKERVLVTTLTKRTAEELTDYLREIGISVQYLHSEIDAIERVEILRSLRKGEFDVLVGINLLREGLDLPEVSLVAILDADKEGYLRSATSLIQTAGRAARHLHGEVILYADVQDAEHPEVPGGLGLPAEEATGLQPGAPHHPAQRDPRRRGKPVLAPRNRRAGACVPGRDRAWTSTSTRPSRSWRRRCSSAANNLEFEKAALLRDQVRELKRAMDGGEPAKPAKAGAARASELWERPQVPLLRAQTGSILIAHCDTALRLQIPTAANEFWNTPADAALNCIFGRRVGSSSVRSAMLYSIRLDARPSSVGAARMGILADHKSRCSCPGVRRTYAAPTELERPGASGYEPWRC